MCVCVASHDDQKERTWARFRGENVHQTISEGINAEIKSMNEHSLTACNVQQFRRVAVQFQICIIVLFSRGHRQSSRCFISEAHA